MLEQVVVFVRIDGAWVPAGLLRGIDQGRLARSVFRYGRRYLERPDAFALDPVGLPLGDRQLHIDTDFVLPNGLRDAGPDRWGRYLTDRRFGRSLSELEYVVANTPDRAGALAFAPTPDSPPAIWTPDGFQVVEHRRLDVAASAGAVEDAVRQEETARLRRLLEYGSSLGGARPKATVVWDDALHLAKFSISLDSRDEPRLEHATMSLASRCGLDVPPVSTAVIDGRAVYLIRRFDRTEDDEPIPYISGLTATGLHESDYPRWSYLLLCDAIRKLSPDPTQDLRELFGRMVFNVLVTNNDDHPRNFGFLYAGDGRWRLSPLFDVVPGVVTGESYFLAMQLGAEGRVATLRNAVSAHARFGLEADEARRVAARLREIVAESWASYFEASGLPRDAIDAVRTNFERAVEA